MVLEISSSGQRNISMTDLVTSVSNAPLMTSQQVEGYFDFFDDFSCRLQKESSLRFVEGISFLSAWTRRASLERFATFNFNYQCLIEPQSIGGKACYAVPCGLVALWLAGNIPTIPFLSIIPALLTGNVCIAKLSSMKDYEYISTILRIMEESSSGEIAGTEILKRAKLVYFDRSDTSGELLSLAANVKMMWGGEEAIRTISNYPAMIGCREIVYGPKYSLGLIGSHLESDTIKAVVDSFARDISMFSQMACSSPHTIFIEKNGAFTLGDVGVMFAESLAKMRYDVTLIDAYSSCQIMRTRARSLMKDEISLLCSEDLSWTVVLDKELSLKPAVHHRTIFITEIDSWREMEELLSTEIQTIGVAGLASDMNEFFRLAARCGISRCVRPGIMNVYDTPWDGVNVMNELVRWVSLNI